MAVEKLKVVYRDPAALKDYEGNARTHSEEQVDQIAAAIKEFGFVSPILIKDDEETIGAGHARRRAALKVGLTEVPTITLRGLTEAQWRAYVLTDNQLALNAGWDEALLRAELQAIGEMDFDLGLLGFEDIEALMAEPNPGIADPETAPEIADPVSIIGETWALGNHRLTCGDCADAAVVEVALGGSSPNLMVTDPPYGVDYDPNWRNSAERGTARKSWTGKTGRKIGATAIGAVDNDSRSDWGEAWALFGGDVAYVWHAGVHADVVAISLRAAGFEVRSQIIWNKLTHIIGRGDYHWKHEPCWYVVRRGRAGGFNRDAPNGRRQSTVWDITHRASETGHSTQKPVECMKRPIENNSQPGEAIYEPFCGSGTTIIAGEMTGRNVRAIELNPVYVDVAIRRWQNFTGKTATLIGDGRSFDEIAAQRLPPPPAA